MHVGISKARGSKPPSSHLEPRLLPLLGVAQLTPMKLCGSAMEGICLHETNIFIRDFCLSLVHTSFCYIHGSNFFIILTSLLRGPSEPRIQFRKAALNTKLNHPC